MASKGLGYDLEAKTHALEAANSCKQLEQHNPRWDVLLGMVHYWFGDLKTAISVTEEALRNAEAAHNKKIIAGAKNNLAWFYAEGLDEQNKDKAIAYAVDALTFSKDIEKDVYDTVKVLDTLGVVCRKFARSKAELEQARAHLQQAHAMAPDNIDIAAHLQEVEELLELEE